MSQAVAREMVAYGIQGSIINMSSINAVVAIGDQLAYAVSKGGINQMTRAMALALAESGIRVNGVGPGTLATDLERSDERRVGQECERACRPRWSAVH